MAVAFVDLKQQYSELEKEITLCLTTVFRDADFIQGKNVFAFEEEFAKYLRAANCIAVNSGTDALIFGLRALQLPPGSEVVLSANTFIAAALAITENCLKPVFSDVDEHDFGMDLSDLKRKINKRTKAVVMTHLYGQPEKIDEIKELIKKTGRKIFLVEDACQAHGAKYKGQPVGTFGIFAAFSFYPSKNLGAYGDGGAIITGSREMKKRYLFLREYGQRKKYHHVTMGRNSRLDEIQASILRIKLKYLDRWNEKRQQAARYYQRLLQSFDPDVIIPRSLSGRQHVFHLYVIRLKKRTQLMEYLAKRNIRTAIHYPIPLHLQQTFKYLGYRRNDLPVSEKLSGEILSLPMYPEIKRNDIREVADNIRSFYGL
ncbi:hypothetical protein A3J20_01335 [Candidatus Gottesmanbacteria bacterium RIFCSPLOWO2_02_FULL_42_29]|nr:MAG: hypothetical protein A2781_06060 [Candidatus Gottesmanbacteria bacterium RIFCSPHIGHO2_01_FULL_42_27]OGG22004.1 MAG: hypothetical protein A3E72_00820 [Candidatus Gottesmanbacteria bacterium RIFCSPHIGHO2_12_FULL_43_26]OGG39223.1 MAG: hypothetical protein A3J20_01335 [Candidatus Gottesmanbacteria bacterium RIFCSPLOWO2_02_FULL_42_29]